jgi:hypothetical protein
MRVSNLLAVALSGAILAACGASANHQNGPPQGTDGDARVQVTNNNWSDVRIYAERDGIRVRLGAVTTNGTESFRIPAAILSTSGTIRLIADPIGSSEHHVTHSLTVWPGQTVSYNVANHLAISWASIRR